MHPNGFSQSTLILLLTLGLSILAHAAVLLWGNSDADTAKLPGQRLQVQVSVASRPASAVDAKTPPVSAEPVEETTQSAPDVTQSIETPPEKQPVPQSEKSTEQVAELPSKLRPVTQVVKEVTASVRIPEPVAPVPKTDRQVAKMGKQVAPPKPEPLEQAPPPPVEPVAESVDRATADTPTHTDSVMDSSQTQQASFQAAQVRQQTNPHYPRLARRRGQEGTVWLRVQVDTSGNALAIDIDRSSGFEILDKAAMKAVRSWRFLPALQDGQAQASYVKIPVKFQLDTAR